MNIFGDQTIKPGDMAMIVRDCCGSWVGIPVRVVKMSRVPGLADWLECQKCLRKWTNIAVAQTESGQATNVPLFWLQKIDPPQEYESYSGYEPIPVKALQPE